ncbi:hypothetical protein J6590_059169 [Homalodisca vitripennis]|nr:hypothetical protein J6590_059169 [Homalodisca vitripennis]
MKNELTLSSGQLQSIKSADYERSSISGTAPLLHQLTRGTAGSRSVASPLTTPCWRKPNLPYQSRKVVSSRSAPALLHIPHVLRNPLRKHGQTRPFVTTPAACRVHRVVSLGRDLDSYRPRSPRGHFIDAITPPSWPSCYVSKLEPSMELVVKKFSTDATSS